MNQSSRNTALKHYISAGSTNVTSGIWIPAYSKCYPNYDPLPYYLGRLVQFLLSLARLLESGKRSEPGTAFLLIISD